MFQQLRDSLRSTPDRLRDLASDAPRPRRTRQPRVESLEDRALCDQGSATFMNGTSGSSQISFTG